MEIPPAEIIDRLTIVKLKMERIGNPEFQKEMKELLNAINNFKEDGIIINQNWIDELYKVNGEEWDLLDKMNKERKGNLDLEKIGRLYLETEKVNKRRAEVKNRIVLETGKGFEEIKKDHPSE